MQQDLGYFDHFAGNGEFVSQISKDVLSVHDVLSEKVTACLPLSNLECIANQGTGHLTEVLIKSKNLKVFLSLELLHRNTYFWIRFQKFTSYIFDCVS